MFPAPLTREALADAEAEPDPRSLSAAERMRRRYPSDVAAAALDQVVLRARAHTKFGDRAATMFFTHDGLEQATRPSVAAHHARRFVAAGVRRVRFPGTIEAHLGWLRAAGFDEVDCFWKSFHQAVYGGYRH